jgi:carboxymethylenebutenolidase
VCDNLGIHKEWITFGEDSQYSGFMARPDKTDGPLPAVLVIQEIWGVDTHIQDVTVRFAQAGYTVLAPELFAFKGGKPPHLEHERIAAAKGFRDSLPPGVWENAETRQEALGKLPQAESLQITETMQGIMSHDIPAYMKQIQAAAKHLRTSPYSQSRKVGVVGFCLGGALSAMHACVDPELAASVIFYGRAPQEEQLAGIQCPVIGFYGGNDRGVTDGVPAFAEAMERSGKNFTPNIYDGAPHAFFNDTRGSYRAETARDAFAKTLQFLNEQLG